MERARPAQLIGHAVSRSDDGRVSGPPAYSSSLNTAGPDRTGAQVGDWAVHVVNVQISDDVSTQILAAAAKGLGSS